MNRINHQPLIISQFSVELSLYEQLLNWSRRNKRRTSERSCLLVFVGSSRRCVNDLLGPIDAQSAIDRRNNVIHHGLFFEFPTHVGHFVTVRLADDSSWLDAATHKQIRETGAPMITATVGVHLWIAPEFMDHANHGFIEKCLARLLAGHLRKIFNQAAERRIEPRTALVDG